MRRIPLIVAAVLVGWSALGTLGSFPPFADAGARGGSEPPSPPLDSAVASLDGDLALVARQAGWTESEALRYQKINEAVGRVAELVAAEQPDVFVGSVLATEPDGMPSLYIKGPASDRIRDIVNSADVAIRIVDGQPYSFAELERRTESVHDALRAAGYTEVVASFDVRNEGRIEVSVRIPTGLASDERAVLSVIPQELRPDVTLAVGDEQLVRPATAFGGMKLQDDGVFECTSGWSVRHADGRTGVTGAGHCTGINQINHPGHAVHPVACQGEHQGQWGDVEWYTTPEVEPPSSTPPPMRSERCEL